MTNRSDLLASIGYSFRDVGLLEQALIHASSTEDRLDSNERLEFLGDAVLGFVTSQLVFALHPDLSEGEMTKIKSSVVSRQACAGYAETLGIDRHITVGKGVRTQGMPSSVPAGVFEAVIAAIFLDGGIEPARVFVEMIVTPSIDSAYRLGHQENFKSMLQSVAIKQFGETPVYRVLDEQGPDHAKCFKIGVMINGSTYEAAWGASKKQAEQTAAKNVLIALGQLVEDGEGQVAVVSPENSAEK